MSDTTSYRFVRVPTTFLEAILQLRLNGTQWCIIFWVLRQTLGWNRQTAPFTWYRVAKELGLDRGGVVRAAHHLIRAGLVYQGAGEVGIQTDPAQWKTLTPVEKTLAGTNVNDDARPRKAMTPVTESDDTGQRKRCPESALLRRPKERSKDRLKTYKEKRETDDARPRFRNGALSEHHPAGEARPIPGKYQGGPAA